MHQLAVQLQQSVQGVLLTGAPASMFAVRTVSHLVTSNLHALKHIQQCALHAAAAQQEQPERRPPRKTYGMPQDIVMLHCVSQQT